MNRLVISLLESIATKSLERPMSRDIVRVLPVQHTVKAPKKELLGAVIAHFPEMLPPQLSDDAPPCQYSIQFRKNTLDRAERDAWAAKLAALVAPQHRVDLARPEVCTLASVISLAADLLLAR